MAILNEQISFAELDEEYKKFEEKFKPKKTTDDCYTPDEVYEVIADWVANEYGLNKADFVRPFYPGGDYLNFDYPDNCVVVDNPPFSILAEIKTFYMRHSVPFFLFCPALTAFGTYDDRLCYLTTASSIIYENGANVATSFVTNLEKDWVVRTCPDLSELVTNKSKELASKGKATLPKYEYPPELLTAAKSNWFSIHGTDFRVPKGHAVRVSSLKSQRGYGKGIFGGGLLLSEKATAERITAERITAERITAERINVQVWSLSDEERAICKHLGEQS